MQRACLVLALALLPGSVHTASASPRAWPAGEVVYRPDCFGSERAQRVYSAPAGGGVAPNMGGVAPPRARPTKRSASPPPSSPAPPPTLSPAPLADADAASGWTRETKPQAPPPPPIEHMAPPRDLPAPPVRQAGPTLDWGATVYLSNDDSMSLASAQRLLYAVMNDVRFTPREVRPHELLNYFSFDTVTPSDAQLFDVLASAEQDGDTLSVAFAVKGATPPRQPLDLTLVVDRSCSMEAEGRMEYTKKGLQLMQDQLEPGDRVDVVLFDDSVCTPLENFVVGRDDPKLLQQTINQMRPRGGTNVDRGLREGYSLVQRKKDTHRRNRRMMLLTDALMNTGDVNPNTVSEIGKAYEQHGVRLTGVGVGRDFNDELLDKLTEKGKGAYVFLGSEAVVERLFGVGFDSLTRTIAHDVQFALDLPDSLAMERFYGEEASTVAADVQPIHYYAGTSQVFLQDLKVRPGRLSPQDPVTLTIRYREASTGEPAKRVFKTTVGKLLDADPRNVRKGRALMAWTDVLLEKAMGGDPCGEALRTYGQRAARVADDAEIAFVNGLVRRQCPGFEPSTIAEVSERVAYKVRVDSDIPIAEVGLVCDGQRWTERLTGSDNVARFTAVPGVCTLTLGGAVEMRARVEVPVTGGDARCLVRGGRVSCG